jgi:hypothetical protein
VTLPEHTKVYVVIPDVEIAAQAHVYSPRLAHPEQAADFAKQIIEVSADAELPMQGQRSGYVCVSTVDQHPERQLDNVLMDRV